MQFQINADTHPSTNTKEEIEKNHLKTRPTNLNKIQNTKHTKKRTITTATMQQQKSHPPTPLTTATSNLLLPPKTQTHAPLAASPATRSNTAPPAVAAAVVARNIPTTGSQQNAPCPAPSGNPKSDCTATIGPNGIGDAKSAGAGGIAGNGAGWSPCADAPVDGG
jgi:hypothetical protein